MDRSPFARLHLILASLLTLQFLLLIMAFNDDWHTSMVPAIVIGALFVWAHVQLTPSAVFLAEFADQFGRGEPQDILVFGAVLKGRVDVKFEKDESWMANGWRRAIAGQVAIGVLAMIATRIFGSSTGFLIFSVFLGWAFARCRAFLWLPIAAASLFLVLVFAKHSVFRLAAAGMFLTYFSVYRQSLLSWASQAIPEPLWDGVRAVVRPALIFAVFFCGSAYLFPDAKLQQEMDSGRHQLAHKMAQGTDGIGRVASRVLPSHDHASGSPFTGGKSASGVSGGSAGAGSAGSPAGGGGRGSTGSPRSAGVGGAAGGMAAAGGKAGSGGGGPSGAGMAPGGVGTEPNGGTGNSDAAGGGRSEQQREQVGEQQRQQAQREMKFDQTVAQLEKLLKLLLVAAAAVFLYLLFDRKRPMVKLTKEERARREKALDDVLEHIKNLRRRKFKNQQEEVIAAYHAYLAISALRGLVKRDGQTPRQFVDEAVKKGDRMKAFSPELTTYFSKVYYGRRELEAQEFDRFRKFVGDIAI